jgi:hypothetical protein
MNAVRAEVSANIRHIRKSLKLTKAALTKDSTFEAAETI